MIDNAWESARRVLCVRLDRLGDVLMTTAAMRAVKERASGLEVVLLTSSPGAEVAKLVPEIDDVLVYDPPWMKATTPGVGAAAYERIVGELRDRRLDAAIVFTSFSQSPLPAALLCWQAGIPRRLAHCRENPYHLLTDWVRETEPERGIRHEVQRQLDLVASVGYEASDQRLSLGVPASAFASIDRKLAAYGLDRHRRWAVMHVGASAPSRRYPADLFARAARSLTLESELTVVFTGSADEQPLVREVQVAMACPSISVVDALDLAELAALIARAPVLVANNSGPVHVAAAVGTPVVDVYALTNPQHTPWQVPNLVLSHDVPCRNCFSSVCPQVHHDCLRLVPPEAVVDATERLLAAGAASQPVWARAPTSV